MSRIAGRQVMLSGTHAWSDSIRDATRHPLFAVIIGTELRRSGQSFIFRGKANWSVICPKPPCSTLAPDEAADLSEDPATGLRPHGSALTCVSDDLCVSPDLGTGPLCGNSRIRLSNTMAPASSTSHLCDIRESSTALRAMTVEQTVSLGGIQSFSDRWIIPFAIEESVPKHHEDPAQADV